MAALTAASWTLTITKRYRKAGRKYAEGTMLIAGVDTYPDGGIPLPAKEKYGFIREFAGILFPGVDPTTGTVSEYRLRYDKTNHKLFLYEEEAAAAGGPLLETDAAEVPGARTWDFIAWGW